MRPLFLSLSFFLVLFLKGQGLDCNLPAQSEYNLKEIYNTTFVDLISFAEVKNYTGAKTKENTDHLFITWRRI